MATNVIKQIVNEGEYGAQTIRMVVRSNERGPRGEQGERGVQGPQGIQGPRGYDGVIQYRAGTGIKITDQNIIEATGGSIAEWGGIQGDIQSQTDLQNALNAKQDSLTAGDGIDITSNTISTNVFTDSAIGAIKGSTAGGKVHAESDGTGSVNGWDTIILVGETMSEPTTVEFVDTANIVDKAVTAGKIDLSTLSGNYSTSEVDTGYTWVDGSPIYKKTVNTGSLPDTNYKDIAHGITGLGHIIKLEGYAASSTAQIPLPYSSNDVYPVDVSVQLPNNIRIYTYSDRTNFTSSYITLYYTKTS